MTLCLHDLTLVRGGRAVVERLSLRVLPGQVLHVRGANGSGKTTLLRCIAALTRPETGAVAWEPQAGEAVDGELSQRLLHIGHRPALSPQLTAVENLAYHRSLHRPGGPSIAEALAAFGLGGLEERLCGTLSAGQQRRVALARLLTEAAELWVLDEPFAALDSEGIAQITALLNTHAARGGVTVVSSHQPLAIDAARLEHLDLGTVAPQ